MSAATRKQPQRLVQLANEEGIDNQVARFSFVLTDWQLVAGEVSGGTPQVRLEVEFQKDKIMIFEHRDDAEAPQRGVWVELADNHLKVRTYDTDREDPLTISISPAGHGQLINEGRD